MFSRARAQQWSRMAGAIGLLFASLPIVSRVFFGGWDFLGAAEIGGALFMVAAYLYVLSRRMPSWRDAALMIDRAGQLAQEGQVERAIFLLGTTIRQNPRVWQAYQYRGQLYLQLGDPPRAAEDFAAAVRLAPDERGLQVLLEQAQNLTRGTLS